MAADRPGDRHRYAPISFRPPAEDREWLEHRAKETGRPLRAILTDALSAYREETDPSWTPPASGSGSTITVTEHDI